MKDLCWFQRNGFNVSVEFYNQVSDYYTANKVTLGISFPAFFYNEFILNDLSLIVDQTNILNMDITDKICSTLGGSIILQINAVVDVSMPYMSVMKKSSKRLLKIKLTNGVQDVYGFECGRYPLSFDLATAKFEKILIRNNAFIRRGLLMLSDNNCVKLQANSRTTRLVQTQDITSLSLPDRNSTNDYEIISNKKPDLNPNKVADAVIDLT